MQEKLGGISGWTSETIIEPVTTLIDGSGEHVVEKVQSIAEELDGKLNETTEQFTGMFTELQGQAADMPKTDLLKSAKKSLDV